MKDSGIEWIGEIPEDWSLNKGKYLFKLRASKGNKLNLQLLSPTQHYGVIPQKIYDELSGMNSVKVKEDTDLSLFKTIHDGDFCISLRSFEGGFEYSKYEGVVSPAYQVFFASTYKTFNGYYKYLFKCQSFIKEMNSYTLSLRDGKNIAFSDFGKTYLTIPPFEVQKSIASFLDNQCSKISTLNNDIEKQIESLAQYKKSIITEAVTKGINPNVKMKDSGIEWIGEIPEHWDTKRAKFIFTPRNDRGNKIELQLLSPTQKYGVIPQALYDEISGMNSVKLKENTDLNLLKTCHKGDYCISLRSFQGGFEYSKYEGVVSPAYQIFYPTIKIADGYYKYLFKEKNFIEKINSFTLSLRDGKPISYFDFSNMYLPLPSAEEQKEIADYLDSKCSAIEDIIATKKQQLEKLEEYKKSLIFEYVTGKKEI